MVNYPAVQPADFCLPKGCRSSGARCAQDREKGILPRFRLVQDSAAVRTFREQAKVHRTLQQREKGWQEQ